ncbi:CCHC-type domain-containing protein [Trichonephila clavipes]|nr:CCHC-type domain-containing protein [Trichonephila clavipes]
MRFNSKEIVAVATQPSYKFDKEGILFVKEKHDSLFRRNDVFLQRWCRLRGNLLFYYKTKDQYSEPAGLFVLEEYYVRLEESAEVPYSFSLGLSPECGLLVSPTRGKSPKDMSWGSECQTFPIFPLVQPIRTPSIFYGEAGNDPSMWLKEYERIAKFNRWDDTMCLANAYLFLKGTARLWYENNEENLSSWEKFQEQLKIAFGLTELFIKQAEHELKNRAQKMGENTQSYIQSVLVLCHKVNPKITEIEKVSHLVKGIAEDVYQSLLVKDISFTSDFIKECQRIEEMNQRRIAKHRFTRLPNVVPVASIGKYEDLVILIRHIVREEVQRMLAPAQQNPQLESPSLDEVIREEVQQALCPVISSRSVAANRRNEPPRRPRTYATVVRQPRHPVEPLPVPRQTDVGRTDDNRPVCIHCGRPGHVVRYCCERRAIFDAYRSRQASKSQLPSPNLSPDECSRQTIRTPLPIPSRGKSPVRCYGSPSPYGRRSPSLSPSRRDEEN